MAFPIVGAAIAGGSILGGILGGKKQGEANKVLREQLALERRRDEQSAPLRALFYSQLGSLTGGPTRNLYQRSGYSSENPFIGRGQLINAPVRTPTLDPYMARRVRRLGDVMYRKAEAPLTRTQSAPLAGLLGLFGRHGIQLGR